VAFELPTKVSRCSSYGAKHVAEEFEDCSEFWARKISGRIYSSGNYLQLPISASMLQI
jgi:hypothetical protein